MRGIPAMKRMMDGITIKSKPAKGTKVNLTKLRNTSGKSFAQNIAGFFQEKFSSRKTPTISDEFELQNASLMQTLSLYEEKNQELERKNKELTELQKELESANNELEEQSAELQEALLSLGDRTVELEENNRRFTLTLDHIKEGILVTDRTGEVKVVNQQFLDLTGKKEEELIGIGYQEWCDTLSSFKTVTEDEWNTLCTAIKSNDEEIFTIPLYDESYANAIQCEVIPVLSEQSKVYGKLWVFT
jgi:PAS domain-containing protein